MNPDNEGISLEAVERGLAVYGNGIPVRIWSGEHRTWWRPDGSGYTKSIEAAGVYAFLDALRRSRHCGPEKRIRYIPVEEPRENRAGGTADPSEVPDPSLAAPRASRGHWSATEEAQARYLIATMTGRTVDDVTEPVSRLLHGLRYASEPDGWIPLADCMPEADRTVLVWRSASFKERIIVAYWGPKHGWRNLAGDPAGASVTHWMALPGAPAGVP